MKHLLYTVSKNDSFSISPEVFKAFADTHPGSEVKSAAFNRTNITILYNRMMEEALKRGFDYLICMHSDVQVDLDKLVAHVEECDGKYDLMGLCGCEKISVSECPLNWFCGSRKYPKNRWGCVCHGELGNHTSFFSHHHPEVMDHAVSCIDGLCIIVSRRAIESGLRFDERLRFNCYDTQISMDAILTHHLRVGCLVEMDLKHYSVGKSILGEDFLEDEAILREKFNFPVPPGSRLEKYLTERRENSTMQA